MIANAQSVAAPGMSWWLGRARRVHTVTTRPWTGGRLLWGHQWGVGDGCAGHGGTSLLAEPGARGRWLQSPEGADMPLDDQAIAQFVQSFPAQVLRPADSEFAQARTEVIWNGAISRQPVLIVRPTSAVEVARALAFARDAGVDVTVRGGGHSAAGAAVADGAVMIDLSRMDDVRVDPEARRAYVGAGASLADLDAATAAHGLAVVAGLVSHTGVAGLTLTGGMGW